MSLAQICNIARPAGVVLSHLEKHGSISPAEAQTVYGMPKVAFQIHQLRQSGIRINSELRRDATGRKYARYSLSRS